MFHFRLRSSRARIRSSNDGAQEAGMNRRALLIAGAASALAIVNARAQQGRRAREQRAFRIACLWMQSEAAASPYHEALLAGMREHGYVPGRDLIVDARYAGGDPGRLPALADELIALNPDVIVGVEAPARTIRARTTSIPIVLPSSVDPVATGLVQSLANPGVNVTGLAFRLDQLVAKSIDLLTEIRPRVSRIALLTSSADSSDPSELIEARIEQQARKAAAMKGLQLLVSRARDAESATRAFARFESERAEGLVVVPSPYTLELRHQISGHARRLRLPSVSALPAAWAEAGGLVSYGPDFLENYRYAATFVDRLLKGASAAQMPIEQPATFRLVVNLRTAREIGITIAPTVLLRADRVIQE